MPRNLLTDVLQSGLLDFDKTPFFGKRLIRSHGFESLKAAKLSIFLGCVMLCESPAVMSDFYNGLWQTTFCFSIVVYRSIL